MQLPQITFTRFLAALSIVWLHFGLFTWPMNTAALSPFGGDLIAAMSYFFILSGFVLVISIAKTEQLPDRIDNWFFWKRRAARIVPLYLLALLLSFAINFRYDPSIPLKWQIQSYYHALFFLQSWKYKMALDVNYPSWSLSVEAFFYLIFPLLYRILNELKNKKLLIISLAAWLLNYYLFLSLKEEQVPTNFLHFFPVLHVATFLTGICFGILFVRNYKWLQGTAKKYIFGVTILATWLILYTAKKNFAFHEDQHNGLLAPYYLLVILSLSLTSGKLGNFFGSKFMVFLGSMSYALYILQFPVYQICQMYIPWFQNKSPESIFYPYLLVLFFSATLAYYFIEKPARRFWMRKFSTQT